MSGWSCLHQVGGFCDLLKKPCIPGDKGCVLFGKALFSDPNTPSNEALKRREEIEKKRKERGYE